MTGIDRNRRRLLAFGGTAAAASLDGCSSATPVVGKRLENTNSYDADAVSEASVDGRNGRIRVRPSDDDRVHVRTVKQSGSVFADLSDVQVETTTESGQLRIEVHKTGDGSFLGGVPSVDVTLRVPNGVRLGDLNTENGHIDVRGVASDAALTTENGHVTVRNVDGFVTAESENGGVTVRDVTGVGDLRTQNGHVDADVAAIRDDTTIRTENGGIDAALAADLDAHLVATTDNGGLVVDLSNFAAETTVDHLVEGRLGSGGPELRFVTENGGIDLSND